MPDFFSHINAMFHTKFCFCPTAEAGAEVTILQPMADIILTALLGLGEIEFAARLVEAGLHMSTEGLQPLLEVAAEAPTNKAQRNVSDMKYRSVACYLMTDCMLLVC